MTEPRDLCLPGEPLPASSLQALARQGFIAAEKRGERTYCKLRWREQGRQRVRYLGADVVRVEQVRAALARLQCDLQCQRQVRLVRRLLAQARHRLAQAKAILEPYAQALGLYYHGYRLCQPASAAIPLPAASPPPEVTSQQRQALVLALQNHALQRPDPLAANLGVLTGDLMGIAHSMANALSAAAGPESALGQAGAFALGRIETYLKVVRHIDRLLQVERQLSTPGRGASGYR
jgi:hypothetical protein